jgi:glycosyltransferase involved in cell wall biosynthesis
MKIGFQGWFLAQPYTGIGQHCIGLLRAIAAQKKSHSRSQSRGSNSADSRPKLIIPVPRKIKIAGIPQDWLHVLPPKKWIPIAGLKKWYWERAQVPAFFAKKNPDWEHYPYPCPLPRYSPNLRSVTVHDLIPWQDARYKSNFIKTRYYKLARHSLVDADHVFTVSQSTHKEMGIPVATLLPNALPKIPKLDRTRIAKIKKKQKSHPALIYLGGYDIRKNVPLLVEAFQNLRKKNPEMELWLIGEAHHKSKYYPEFPTEGPDAEGVRCLGKLPNRKLYEILTASFGFIHFSDSEGFNIPLLQTMAAGLPAIVADIPVNREVSADSALFITLPDPSTPAEKAMPAAKRSASLNRQLSAKIRTLKNAKSRSRIVKAQKAAARRYSWERSAKLFLAALKK